MSIGEAVKAYWKKALLILADTVLAVYLVLAMTSFNNPKETVSVCSKVDIDIESDGDGGFLNADDVKQMLEQQHIYPLAQPLRCISSRKIEETLESSPYVNQAECYKTQEGDLCISLRQHTPVVRVMDVQGNDYYVDSEGGLLPNSTRYTCDLVVATGIITRKYAQETLTKVGNTLRADKFWQQQVEQLNVLGDGTLELVPRVGDHIVYLGQPTNLERKLERLKKFYKYGLNKTGWNKYSRISVEYDNQIICKKRI